MSSLFKKIKKLPDSPGVYLFLGRSKRILYIGKATSIRDRVRSYFNIDIGTSRGPLIEKMLTEVRDIDFQKTDSVLEALILESALIKKHKPRYNVKEKSDKSFNYVVITDEDFPRVLIMRERELILKPKAYGLKPSYFGPFPQGSVLKETLKIVRKIFPFRDTCLPAQHSDILQNIRMLYVSKKIISVAGKPCFNRQIGLCPGVCTGEISKEEYQKTIRNIKLLFEGKKSVLIAKLTAEMYSAARKKEFERAGEIKKTLFALKHIQDISLIKNYDQKLFSNSRELENREFRIEAYDVAHMAGKHIVGAMVVLENGETKKSDYRKFNIKTITTGNDVGALKEIIERRLAHTEWPLPRLVVVDGGKAQINAVENIFKKYGIEIPVVGVVKDEYHRPKNILGRKDIISRHKKEILLANNEVHRFAIAFHKKKRKIIENFF